MTLDELCNKYDLNPSTVKNQFKRIAQKIQRDHGVTITKKGRGATAEYIEEVPDNRALTMFDEAHDLIFNNESLDLMSAEFVCFLGLISTPMRMFRGTFSDFIHYIGADPKKISEGDLEDVFLELVDRNLIVYDQDEDVIILYVKRRVEKEMRLGIEMVEHCRKLEETYNKQKGAWIKLLKTWIGIQICAEEQPFTMRQLAEITGLSAAQLRDAKKILEKDEIFKTSRAGYYLKCLGSNVELNAFYN